MPATHELFPSVTELFNTNSEREEELGSFLIGCDDLQLSASQSIFAYDKSEVFSDAEKEGAGTESNEALDPVARSNTGIDKGLCSKSEKKDIIIKKRRNCKFTREEDKHLLMLVDKYGESAWSLIAKKMKGRNRKQLRERYINFLKNKRISSKFTPEEDIIIMQFVEMKGRKWSFISEMLPGKTPIMIKNRYYSRLRYTNKNGDTHPEDCNSLLASRADSFTNEGTLFSINRKRTKTMIMREKNEATLKRLRQQESFLQSVLTEIRGKIINLASNMNK
eukprot:TRINITY_DN5393_c0_g1_i10.p1 TRINITY_DN5393_c0_g1~~TRINITY_DN5393_c0_g1_i10.p1  ORF type:complete len:278 (-),score=33.18 TRINITY_DN5393_c0_g1_i10:231-1064(-)